MSDFIWVEKYRPTTIDECILPKGIKKTFQDFVERGEIPNMLLSGPPGIGKTTVAKALCNQLGADYYVINGSDEGRFLDTVRNNAKNFASTVSLTSESKHKVIIIDEADNTTSDVQLLLRASIEEFSKNCRFIFTCNYKNKIIEPLHSRCSVVDFSIHKRDKPAIATQFFSRLTYILEQEKVDTDKKVVAQLINNHFPDWRRVLNELQKSSTTGTFSWNNGNTSGHDAFSNLLQLIKDKDFKSMRQWVSNNIDTDASYIFRGIYDNMSDHISPQSIPQVVLILADYQYKNAFVADHELNVVACLTEIMANVEFK